MSPTHCLRGEKPPGEIIKEAASKVAINCVCREAHPSACDSVEKGEITGEGGAVMERESAQSQKGY